MKLSHVLILLAVLALLVGGAVAVRKLGNAEAERRERLLPKVRTAFDGVRAELAAVHGIELAIVSTRRTEDEQAAKVAAGVSATNQSWHLLGRAVDVQTGRRNSAGAVVWDPNGKDLASYQRLHEVARRYGFRGVPQGSPFDSKGNRAYINGSKGPIWDGGHLEFTDGLTFAQAKERDAKTGMA